MRTGLRLLHVEDDPDILSVVHMALTMLGGYEMDQFKSGTEAVENAATARCDLLLLDMMMPGLNGLETLAQLRRHDHFAQTPAVLFTAKLIDLPDVKSAGAQGIIGTIRKPFDAMTLSGQIAALWQQFEDRNGSGGPGGQVRLRA